MILKHFVYLIVNIYCFWYVFIYFKVDGTFLVPFHLQHFVTYNIILYNLLKSGIAKHPQNIAHSVKCNCQQNECYQSTRFWTLWAPLIQFLLFERWPLDFTNIFLHFVSLFIIFWIIFINLSSLYARIVVHFIHFVLLIVEIWFKNDIFVSLILLGLLVIGLRIICIWHISLHKFHAFNLAGSWHIFSLDIRYFEIGHFISLIRLFNWLTV